MSLLREEVLVKSLKHVSLQRLRSLKMDMDKLARDSRIKNANSFWSLLELHNIKLDERMRREFGQLIIDNRGVNVEIALRHLKKAQRQTGRDSVEVLPKEPDKPAPKATRLTPSATPIVPTFKPSPRAEKRNYKLDKFREKARGLGKLKLALKEKSPVTSRGPLPAQHPAHAQKVIAVVEKKKSSSGHKIEESSQQPNNNAPISFVDKSTAENAAENSTKESKQQPLLKILLHEETTTTKLVQQDEKKEPTPEDKKETTAVEGLQVAVPDHSLNKETLETIDKDLKDLASDVHKEKQNMSSFDQKAMTESKEQSSKVMESSQSKDAETCVEEKVEENKKKGLVSSEKSSEKSGLDDKVAQENENLPKTDVGDNSSLDSLKENLNVNETSPKDTQESIRKPLTNNTEDQEPLSKENMEQEKEAIEETVIEATATSQEESSIASARSSSTAADEDVSPDETPLLPKEEQSQSMEQHAKEETSDQSFDEEDEAKDIQSDGGKSDMPTERHSAEQVKETSASPQPNQSPSENTEEESHQETNETKMTTSFAPDGNSAKAVPPQEELPASETKEPSTAMDDQPKPNEDKIRQADVSDSHSITTLSSDDESQADEDMDFGLDSGHQRWRGKGDLGLAVQWVYGCSSAYPQCTRITGAGELVYFSGCVVIVYNHVRKTQRHYLEHSGFITGLALHPSEPRVASSQLGSSRAASSSTDISSAVGFGQTHIRVWNHDNMETVTVIGLGILRNPVYIMQFLDYQDYFVTIENDESCTLTLWEGGCRVTSVNTAFEEAPAPVPVIARPKVDPKRSKTSFGRATVAPAPSARPETGGGTRKPAHIFNGPRCVGAIHTGEGKFVTAGKRQINFWRLLDEYDEEYVHGESGGAQLSSPVTGHFGGNFFKAEYLSCCCFTDRFPEGRMLTGDSNGTLLLWDEEGKMPVRGFAHAHECHLSSICVSDSGHIFTSGTRDKQVKAFICRKGKMECCGKLLIPAEFGSATCLAVERKTLFVATERNSILAARLNFEQSASGKPNATKLLHKRTQSTQSLKIPKIPVPEEASGERGSSVLVCWEEQEVCRSWSGKSKCVCALRTLKYKKRKLKGTENLEEYRRILAGAPATIGMKSAIRQLSKSAGLRRKFPDNSTTIAWKSKQEKLSQFTSDKNQAPSYYPRLRAHERILLREKAREESGKFDDLSALQNVVRGVELFDVKNERSRSQFFLTASDDGWLHIYSASEQTIVGRCKIPELHGVRCVDVSARRQFVAIGNTEGTLTMARINKSAFELFPPTSFYCSTEGRAAINQLRFSPSGCKLLVSVGCEVAVCRVTRSQVVEIARCVGHRSRFVTGLDWTKEKHQNVHYIRSCSMKPEMELKVWNANAATEVVFPDDQDENIWATHSCVLNFNAKGQWSPFNDSSYTSHSVQMNLPKCMRHPGQTGGIFCLGDVDGVVTTGAFPCLDSTTTRNYRAHISSITSIVGLTSKQHVLTTAEGDPSVVQWKIQDV